jgi:predicted AAA+ superfamily ATPase
MGKSAPSSRARGSRAAAHGGARRTASFRASSWSDPCEDIDSLPACLTLLKASRHRFIVFCDDLSFDHDDTSYKSLKAVLEGGIEGRPANVIFYATSNRRHLMPRDMIENERSTAINPAEAVEEKVSLSDRFGLWLGFHNCSQDQYLTMVRSYAEHYGLGNGRRGTHARRARVEHDARRPSGRVAWRPRSDVWPGGSGSSSSVGEASSSGGGGKRRIRPCADCLFA